jgi:hypothetical protein
MRPLGKNQKAWLKAIAEHSGYWHRFAGYGWSQPSETIRLCRALEKRLLLQTATWSEHEPTWEITELGRRFLTT